MKKYLLTKGLQQRHIISTVNTSFEKPPQDQLETEIEFLEKSLTEFINIKTVSNNLCTL